MRKIPQDTVKPWRNKRRLCKSIVEVLLFALIYIPWFSYLEKTVVPSYWLHIPLDDSIPFLPAFIVPYLLWFPFMAGFTLYFMLFSPALYRQYSIFLAAGMLLCLLLYTLFPNGQALRPDRLAPETLWTGMVQRLYAQDTPTNVCPSIHTYNTLAVQIALLRDAKLRRAWWVQVPGHLLAVLIIIATVTLKQHSIVDVFAAFALAAVLYPLLWRRRPMRSRTVRSA